MANLEDGALLGAKALAQVAQVIAAHQRRLRNPDSDDLIARKGSVRHLQVQLIDDLPAATDSFTTPGTATAYICERRSDGNLATTGRIVNVVNRDTNFSQAAEGYMKLEWIAGEWQPYGGGLVSLIHGIVNADLTRGYYTIEIADWSGSTPVTDEVPDICLQATGSLSTSGDDNCADITLPAFESQLIGTGVYVLAYDPESVLVPLEVGSDCVVADMGATNALGSQSASSGTTEPVFQIVRGYQTHVAAYDKEYECCDGVWTLITKKTYIFAAKECTPATCANC